MDKTQQVIRGYFKKLGLEPAIADLYLALHSHGPQTISALARNSRVERTRIYRLIDQLGESNLVELETNGARGIIKAAPIANLRILINQRSEALRNLEDELDLIEQTLARNSLSNPAVRVQFYSGPEGIRQMLQHELEADGPSLALAFRSPDGFVGKPFMDGWYANFAKQGRQRQVLLQATEEPPEAPIVRDAKGLSRRMVTEAQLKITHSSVVYGETVALYLWKGGDIHGVEWYNQDFAGSQRQLFELLWAQARPA